MLEITSCIILLILNALLLNQLMNANKIIKIYSYSYAWLYMIMSIPITQLSGGIFILLSNLLLILTYNELLQISSSKKLKKNLFKSGFFLGLMTLLNYHYILFFVLLLFSLLNYQQFSWKNLMIQTLGLFCPLILYFSTQLIIYNELIIYEPFIKNTNLVFLDYLWSKIFLIIFSIISIRELYYNFYKKPQKSKNAFELLYLIMVIIGIDIIIGDFKIFIYFTTIPLTIIISNYLIYTKSFKFRTFLLGLFIVLIFFETFLKI